MAEKRDPPFFLAEKGLVTFGPELLAVKSALERCFQEWASRRQARSMQFPPLIRVKDLDRLDYFRNFPHLCFLAAPIRPERLADECLRSGGLEGLASSLLVDGEYALLSAACYPVYLHLADAVLSSDRMITTLASCFRNEDHYDGLTRLAGFTMREIVCVGGAGAVRAHLDHSRQWILDFAGSIGLHLEVRAATDPFHDPAFGRAIMQRILPVKEEFVYAGTLAISSINYHRNFFGERCNIRMAGGEFAHSGCVGMGLERWIHALLHRHAQDWEAIVRALESTGGVAAMGARI